MDQVELYIYICFVLFLINFICFYEQANKSIVIPKDHHKWVLGKMGQRLKDLERDTETKITVPAMNDPSETVTVTGTKEGIERAIHEIKMISEEQVVILIVLLVGNLISVFIAI